LKHQGFRTANGMIVTMKNVRFMAFGFSHAARADAGINSTIWMQ
jgi:hypothetical protein